MLKLIDRLVGTASGGLAAIGAVAMILMMIHIVVDVTGRYLFNNPIPGTLESVTYYYMVAVTALPFAYVTRSQGQISVEMFTNWLPRALDCAARSMRRHGRAALRRRARLEDRSRGRHDDRSAKFTMPARCSSSLGRRAGFRRSGSA